MKVFIPVEKDAEKAEHVYQATKKFAAEKMGWPIGERRIRTITYKDKGKTVRATVGDHEPREGELVFAILESNTYLVCTPNRGVLGGMPIMVGKGGVTDSEDFDLRPKAVPGACPCPRCKFPITARISVLSGRRNIWRFTRG